MNVLVIQIFQASSYFFPHKAKEFPLHPIPKHLPFHFVFPLSLCCYTKAQVKVWFTLFFKISMVKRSLKKIY
jgi:hypothetical protein